MPVRKPKSDVEPIQQEEVVDAPKTEEVKPKKIKPKKTTETPKPTPNNTVTVRTAKGAVLSVSADYYERYKHKLELA